MLEIEVDHCHVVAVDLYSNDFVLRWTDLFEQTASTCSINQEESFSCNLTAEQCQQRVLTAIGTINQFLKRDFIECPDIIDWTDRQWYNYLHEKFESLSGPYGQPSRLFIMAPATVKQAIRCLNFYIHKLETTRRERDLWYISFDKDCYQRYPLMHSDYQYFCNVIESGQVFVQYAELGKTTIDLYNDGLPSSYPGLKNLHYYSAEISCYLGDESISLFTDDFQLWTKHNGIDISDPYQGLGMIPVGSVRNVDKARQIVYNGNNITNLRMI
jgi:hypothetical protein